MSTNTRTLDDGRIVRITGTPWVVRWRAEQVLNELNLQDTHIVAGFGNEGPRGREYWLKRKFKSFTPVSLLDNQNQDPVDSSLVWTLDIKDENPDNAKEAFIWEVDMFGHEWGMKYSQGRIAFLDQADYKAFKRQVVTDQFLTVIN